MLVKRGLVEDAWGGVTQAPKPRSELGRLLDAAKEESGKQWLEIAIGARLSPSTIQSWINGNTKKPPLFPIAHLATYLGISPQDLVKAALADYATTAQSARTDQLGRAAEELRRRVDALSGDAPDGDDSPSDEDRPQSDQAG